MRAYLKTPLINKCKMVPHTVEHCVGHANFLKQKNFDLIYGIEGLSTPDFTYYEFDNRITNEQIIGYLTNNIDKESLEYELPVIDEELQDINYDQRIYEYIIKKYIDSEISLNDYEDVKRENIKQYYNKYYIPSNIIIVDEKDYSIKYQGFKPIINSFNPEILVDNVDFEGDKYKLLLIKQCDSNLYWKSYFFFRIICFFCYMMQRHKNQTYFYLEPYFYQYDNTCFVLIGDFDYTKLNEAIFEQGKKYIIDMLEKGDYFKEKFFLNKFFYGITKDKEEVLKLYNSYTINDFIDRIK